MSLFYLTDYISNRKLPIGKTVEETINTVLESLINESNNSDSMGYRDELISSACLIFLGLSNIKDPVKLYKNLALTFERRGYCIFTNTVVNAFIRLQNDCVKQRRIEEFKEVYFNLSNRNTCKILSQKLPTSFLEEILTRNYSIDLNKRVYSILFSKKEYPKGKVLNHIIVGDKTYLQSFIEGFLKRPDITIDEVKKIIPLLDDVNQKDLVYGYLYSKPEYLSKQEFIERLNSSSVLVSGLITALKSRPDLTQDDLLQISNSKVDLIRNAALNRLVRSLKKDKFYELALQGKVPWSIINRRNIFTDFKTDPKLRPALVGVGYSINNNKLKFNSGKRGQRTRRINQLTKSLRA